MVNYLNNNILLINELSERYSKGIDVDEIIKEFINEKIFKHTSFDYGRFRVFIDSCLLLLNKEKLNRYVKDEYSFTDFFNLVEKDAQLCTYLEYIRCNSIFSQINKPCIFYSCAGLNKGPWNQVATIRNAYAHMQYGNFFFQENGLLIFFGIYNKDKGIKKDEGIVFEPVMHEFVKGYFSNYSFGIPFRSSFFMRYSLEENRETSKIRYYEITAKKNVNKKYDGYISNVISDLIKNINDGAVDSLSYIYSNESQFDIKEYKLEEKINLSNFANCSRIYRLNNEKYFYGIKTILDFETELSNFLVHIGQLNDCLYEFSVLKKCNKYANDDIEKWRLQYVKRLKELKEDESADLAFKIGFSYLKLINFALRIEDDDYVKIDYSCIDISDFVFDNDALNKYVTDNKVTEYSKQKYVIERVRNSLMHGNISCEVEEKGEIIIIFTDSFNNRKDVIKISLNSLERFLNQDCLYAGIPKQTQVLVTEHV